MPPSLQQLGLFVGIFIDWIDWISIGLIGLTDYVAAQVCVNTICRWHGLTLWVHNVAGTSDMLMMMMKAR
jgi:hypothetical protein